MKKGLFMAACVAATLSSCTQNEAIETVANEAISFSTYVGQNTRAGILDLPGLKAAGAGFYVLGYSTGATDWVDGTAAGLNFMLNENVNWTEPAWGYTNIKYWPNNVDGTNPGKVSFFAYAPADAAVVVAPTALNESAAPTIAYTCPTAVTDQVDLVADAQKNQTKATNAGKVNFTFGHLLSKIAFAAKKNANYDNAEITVKGLTVTYGTGLVQKNVYKMDSEAWSVTEIDATKYAADAEKGTVYSDATGMELGWNVEEGVAVVSPFSPDAATATNFLMMIPQTVVATGDLKATMTYDVKDAARGTTVTNMVTVDLPAITWEMGKQYTYHLSVTLTGVVFDVVSVGDWSDGTTQPGDSEI